MKVIPTLLTTTASELKDQLSIFQQHFDRIQLDIADGELVPNKTVLIQDIITLWMDAEITISDHVSFDFHLMAKDYLHEVASIAKLQELGMKVNTVLINATLSPDLIFLSSQHTFSFGLDISPDVQISELEHYELSDIPAIQVMTVKPGFQGSPFLEDMLIKLTELRDKGFNGSLFIDGGINESTIPLIVKHQTHPDFLCIGSYITKAGITLPERLNRLKTLLG